MDLLLIIPIILAFIITLVITPRWIKKAHSIGLEWDDMNKLNAPKPVGSGGLMVLFSFLIASFIFVAYRTFIIQDNSHMVEIVSLLLVISIIACTGFLDDMMGWKKGGLSKRSRIFLALIASIPLVAINAGKHVVNLPFLGNMDLGLFYPLLFIPIGLIGATFAYNCLAGFNGLEAGQGAIILSALSLVAFLTGNSWLSVVGLIMVASLLAFLFYNFVPAKVFPGNSITTAVGALIAMMCIFGNFEKIAVFFFIPYIFEVILKSRGKLNKHSFGLPQKDGSLKLRYDKLYGMTHVGIYVLEKLGIKPTEKRVVYLLWSFQLLIVILGFIIFRRGLF